MSGKYHATEQTMSALRRACLPIMEAYQSDLGHDARWLFTNPRTPFLHVCTNSSTHIYAIPDDYGQNEAEPYLFGKSTPREIARGIKRCLEMFATRRPVLFHYGDGAGKVKRIEPAKALQLWNVAMLAAEAKLNGELRRAG